MKKTNLNAIQIEAIAVADAHTNNAILPTYTELRDALNALSVQVLHATNLDQDDPLRAHADKASELVVRAL